MCLGRRSALSFRPPSPRSSAASSSQGTHTSNGGPENLCRARAEYLSCSGNPRIDSVSLQNTGDGKAAHD